MDERGEWGEIRRAHHQYLDRVLETGMAPDHRSIARHDSAILDYIDAIIPDLANPLPDVYEKGSDRLPFDPQAIADARTRTLALIVQRRGQSEFREALLRAYDSTCCFSDCTVEHVLEAAHIIPYQGLETNHVRNGLLLRTDLHTLFDLGLLTVNTATMTIVAASALAGSIYADLDGRSIRLPRDPRDQPAQGFLDYHRERSRPG